VPDTPDVLSALTRRPLAFPLTAWPWRAVAHLLAGGLPAAACGLAVGGLLAHTSRLGPVTVAVCVAAVLALACALAGPLDRRRLRLVDRAGVPPRAGVRGAAYGAFSVLVLGWADLALLCLSAGVPAVLLTAPLQPASPAWAAVGGPVAGALLLPAAAYPPAVWAGVRAAVARAVLAPPDGEVREVRRSRSRLVDAFEAERRRIERDLHDGAQQRLVALSMRLGLARLDLPAGSRAARDVADAQRLAEEALAELRELIRGVHPRVLTDRGLPAAVRDVAGRSPLPVDLDLDLPPGRLPAPVEVAAYFAVSEALANAARHSGAARCRVTGRVRSGTLTLEVRDDGRGGADPAAGTGLTGLADRVAAVDGRVLLSSPAGGPTTLRLEIPCDV
jgi:signal transduction histidine kinase